MAGNFTDFTVKVYDHTLNTLLATITDEVVTVGGSEAMSSVGDGRLEVMASSTAASYLTEGNVVFATVIDAISGLGFGICGFIIKNVSIVPDVGGTLLRVSGPVLLQELNYIDFGDDVIDDGSGGVASNDLAQAIAKATAWSFSGSTTGTTNGTYVTTTRGDSVLDVLREISKQSGGYFYKYGIGSADRELKWEQSVSYPGSAYVLTDDATAEDANTGVILKARRVEDGDEVATRLYAFGAGSGDDRVTIADAEGLVTVPSGYSVSWANSLITNTTLESTHAVVQESKSFSQIRPADDSSAAAQSAAIALFYTALNYLQARSEAAVDYKITAVSHQRIRPGDTIEVMLDSVEYGTYDEIVVAQDITRRIEEDGVLYFDIQASSRLIPYTFGSAGLTTAEYMIRAIHDLQTAVANNSNTPVGTTISTDHGALTGLTDDDHPQYLLADGSRQLTGNLGVSAGVTIDGVDISAHAADASAHHDPVTLGTGGLTAKLALAGQVLTLAAINHSDLSNVNPDDHHDPVTVGDGLSLSTQQVSLTTPGTLSGTSTNVAAGNHTHFIAGSSNPGATTDVILKTAADGSITLVNMNVSSLLTTASLNVTGNVASDLIPSLTDTYDLGDATHLWRKGWLSELESILFVENTIQVLGGWFWVPHGQGTLQEDVDSTETDIDFGSALSVGDFIILRGNLAVEYMEVTAVVTAGSVYTVTRDVDGTGANTWPQGHVWVNLGQPGDGRIEFDAQTAGPQIRIVTQGATYNAQDEIVRIGDMTGWGGAGLTEYGQGIGDYSGGNFLYYTPTEGLVIGAGGGKIDIDDVGLTVYGERHIKFNLSNDVIGELGPNAAGFIRMTGSGAIGNDFITDAQIVTGADWNVTGDASLDVNQTYSGKTCGKFTYSRPGSIGGFDAYTDWFTLPAGTGAVLARYFWAYGANEPFVFNIQFNDGGSTTISMRGDDTTGNWNLIEGFAAVPSGATAVRLWCGETIVTPVQDDIWYTTDVEIIPLQDGYSYISLEPDYLELGSGGEVGIDSDTRLLPGRSLVFNDSSVVTVTPEADSILMRNGNIKVYGGGIAAGASSWLSPGDGEVWASGDGRLGGGIAIGDTSLNPSTGQVVYTGNLTPRRSSVDYTAYPIVPLTTVLASTNFNGATKSTADVGYYTAATEFGGLPSAAKGIFVRVSAYSTTAGDVTILAPVSGNAVVINRINSAGNTDDTAAFLPLDSSGRFYFYTNSSAVVMTVTVYGYII